MLKKLMALSGITLALLSACGPSGSDEDSIPTESDAGEPNAQRSFGPLTDQGALKLSQQATFGASQSDLDDLKLKGIETWLEEQISSPYIPYTDRIREEAEVTFVNESTAQRLFWERAIHGDDQLRQRMAYALSQIVVVSMTDPQLRNNVRSFAVYLDLLQEHALGNYCQLIRDVSFNPAMGLFLTHLGNPRADEVTGFLPDENYAREIMQLFTIGLEELDQQGRPQGRPTYSGADVQGLAAVFTGLSWADTDFFSPRVTDFNRYLPMESFLAQHEPAPKAFLGTVVDVGNDAVLSIDVALETLLSHPNLAPFISKQLIQKLVTSNPSPEYVGRVAQVFNEGRITTPSGQTFGSGQRCDLAATAVAILTDNEARQNSDNPSAGKIRNPVLRLANLIRAFRVEQQVTMSGPIPLGFVLDRLESADELGINAFVSPSVFNFFRPGYVGPGTESAELGLVTPEYQIATTPAMVGYINTMEDFIDGPSLSDNGDNIAVMNLNNLIALADDPQALVAKLDQLLTGGTLSERNRQEIERAVMSVVVAGGDIDNDRRRRTELALLMTVISPEYMVQR